MLEMLGVVLETHDVSKEQPTYLCSLIHNMSSAYSDLHCFSLGVVFLGDWK